MSEHTGSGNNTSSETRTDLVAELQQRVRELKREYEDDCAIWMMRIEAQLELQVSWMRIAESVMRERAAFARVAYEHGATREDLEGALKSLPSPRPREEYIRLPATPRDPQTIRVEWPDGQVKTWTYEVRVAPPDIAVAAGEPAKDENR